MKCLFWLILFPALLFGQTTTIDSLKNSLAKGKPEHAAYYFSLIGYEFSNTLRYDSALKYYYKVPIRHTDSSLVASTFNGMGVAYKEKAEYDSSIHYYQQALPMYQSLHDTTNAVTVITNLAVLYEKIGFYEKALEYAFDAIAVLERKSPDRTLASGYNTVAEIYRTMRDHDNAYLYYRKALLLRKKINFCKGEGHSYHNLGELFFMSKQYDSAIVNLSHALKIKQETNDEGASANTMIVLGDVYTNLHQLSMAENYLVKAWQIKQRVGDRKQQATVLNSLGRLKLEQKQLTSASLFLMQAEGLAREAGELTTLRDNLELQVRVAKALGHYPKAIQYAEEWMAIKDSLLNKEKAESLIALQTRYETEKKEQHIRLLEQDKLVQQAEIKSKQSWISSLIITIALTTIIAVLLLIGFRSSQRNRQKVELLLKELHHRVKNNLQILSSILSLQSMHLKDEDAIQAIKSSESRVNTMALIHKKLYKEDNSRTIDMHEYVTELSSFLMHSYGYTPQSLQLTINGEGNNVDVDKAIPIGLILNELISNALKYAYPQQQQPQLNISLLRINATHFKIEVSDNGKGIDPKEKNNNNDSFGLKMVNTLVRELKGEITVATKTGTTYTLQLPLHE